MEHHIAQSSPISPRKKGMEGSRQALLYGVYDAFAGARTLISKRLCALITAIGIAVLTISSSAWASHDDTAVNEVTNVETDGTTDAGTGTIGDGSVHNEHLAEVNDLTGMPATNPGTEGAVGPLNINNDAITSRTIGGEQVCGSENNDACGIDATGTPEARSHIRPDSIGTDDLAEVDTAGPEEGQNGAVGTTNINDGAVTNDKLAEVDTAGPEEGQNGAVDTTNINDGAVTNDKLAEVDTAGPEEGQNGAVDTTNINTDAIDSRTIATGAVDNDELAPDAVETENIGAGEVCGSVATALGTTCAGTATPADSDIGPGSIGETDLADDAVTENKILNEAVTADKLANGAVVGGSGGDIMDGSITTHDLAEVNDLDGTTRPGLDGAVNNLNINTGEVDSRTLKSVDTATTPGGNPGQNGAVSTDKINDDAITTGKILDQTVTGSGNDIRTRGDIADETITENEIRDGAVRTDEIRDDAVTRAKIDDSAVGGGELGEFEVCGSVDNANCDGSTGTRTHIKAGSIGENDLAAGAVTNVKIRDEAVTEGKIRNDAVTENKIRDDAVTNAKLVDVDPTGQNGAVSTSKINDEAVTHRKLRQVNDLDGTTRPGQDGAVDNLNINNEAVTSRTLKKVNPEGTTNDDGESIAGLDGAVSEDNINNNAVSERTIDDQAVSTRTIEDGAVRGRKIADNAITVVGSAGVPEDLPQPLPQDTFRARIVRHSIGLDDLSPEVTNVFRRLEGDIDRLDEGIAMSHAISMIKVPEGKEFGISFAGGFYQDKQAAAIGVGFRPSDGLLLSAGASYGFDSEEVGGAISINFGF